MPAPLWRGPAVRPVHALPLDSGPVVNLHVAGNWKDVARREKFADAAIIARKSSGGRELKALERPGLWNGSMARWTTVFVEIPEIVFNPVKTVNVLLKEVHQPG